MWKPMYSVWQGGTAEMEKLKGKRVRVKRDYTGSASNGEGALMRTATVKTGRIGLICASRPDGKIFIGFSGNERTELTTVDQLYRTPGSFALVFGVGSWSELQNIFEIDA